MIHPRVVTASLLVVASVLGALGTSPAAADVDVQVPLALVAKGTLLPAGEVETYRFDATNGTLVTFQATAGRGAHLAFSAHLFDAGSVEVPIPAKLLVITAKKLAVHGLPLTATGAYRLEVSATGTGDYSLTLVGKPQAKFAGTLPVPQSGGVSFPFFAPPGARVTLTAKRARASHATPRFGTLSGAGVNQDLSGSGTLKATSHTVVLPAVGGTGDLSVVVGNAGTTGDVAVAVSVKPKKVKTLQLDTRGSSRGRPFGGETVVVRTVGAAGGAVSVADAGSDLVGAGVRIPAGAVSGDTVITVASAPPLPPSVGDQASGPTLFLGPPGLTFGAIIDIVLPYDPARIPVGSTSNDLRVLVVEDDGSRSIEAPSSVDDVARTVTIKASGFSSCVAVSQVGQQPLGVRPGGDEFWVFFLKGSIRSDGTGDSRARNHTMEFGDASFFSSGVFQVSTSTRNFEYVNSDDPAPGGGLSGNLQATAAPNEFTTTWNYGADGQSVVIQDGPVSIPVVTSLDGNFLVARSHDAADAGAEASLFLRKNTTPLTAAALAGTYHLMTREIRGESRGFSGVSPVASRLLGTATLDAAGRFKVTGSQRETDLSSDGTPTSRLESLSVTGSFVIEASGTVLATFPPPAPGDTTSVFRFFPGPGGAVLLGTDRDPNGTDLMALVMIRQGSGLGSGTLSGEYRGAEFEVSQAPYTVTAQGGGDIHVADFHLRDTALGLTLSGTGSLVVRQSAHGVQRDPSAADGVRIENGADPDQTLTITVAGNGKFAVVLPPGEGGAPVGAVTADGMFGCGVNNLATDDGSNGILFFVKLPPRK